MPPNNLGLVGYWSFNDATSTIATDNSGNRNHGTLTNMTNAAWVDGKISKALDFDGTNDLVEVADSNSWNFGTGAFSISAWVKWNTLATSVLIGTNTSSSAEKTPGWYLLYNNSSHVLAFDSYNSGWQTAVSGSFIPFTETWYHVVVKRESGGELSIHINGSSVSSASTDAGDIQSGDYPLSIGGINGTTAPSFVSGSLDEVRIYSRALSATEISNLYSKPKRVQLQSSQNLVHTSNLVGLWSFNGKDMSGTTVFDRSPELNHGVVTNGAKKTYGVFGQAVRFDGVDDYVNVPHSSSLSFSTAQPFTIMAWVLSQNITSRGTIVSKYSAPGGGNEYGYKFYVDENYKLVFEFRAGAADNKIQVMTDNTIYSYAGYAGFKHLEVSYDGSSNASGVSISINGTRIYAVTVVADGLSGDTTTNNPDLNIGMSNGSSDAFLGVIDEVRIYDVVTGSSVRGYFALGPSTITAVALPDQGPSYDFSTLTTSLLQHITFDDVDYVDLGGSGEYTDKTGNLYNATPAVCYSAPSCLGHTGQLGQAMHIDSAISEFVTLPKAISSNSVSGLSVSLWVKDSGSGVSGRIISMADSEHQPIVPGTSGSGGFLFDIESDKDLVFEVLDQGSVWKSFAVASAIDTGWHMYTFTFSNTTLKIYKDGSLISTNALDGNLDLSIQYWYALGYSPQSGVTFYDGYVDDFRIYDRALTPSEVDALYHYTGV